MTRKTTSTGVPTGAKAKRLKLDKQTLKDLAADSKGKGPAGGRIPISRITCATEGCPTLACTKI